MDYYPIIKRAIASVDLDDARMRSLVFRRTKELMTEQFRTNPQRWPEPAIEAELQRFDAAAARMESDIVTMKEERRAASLRARADQPRTGAGRALLEIVSSFMLLIGVIGYIHQNDARLRETEEAATLTARDIAAPLARESTAPQPRTSAIAADKPAFAGDGGPTDGELPYYQTRQAVSYRSDYAEGTIVVDRSRHFLYLVEPSSRAVRYIIGVGEDCPVGPGLQRIAEKPESPGTAAWPDPVVRAAGGAAAGVENPSQNPNEARALYFDNGIIGIYGNDSPQPRGDALSRGCFRLMNDDALDLDQRTSVGATVVVLD